MANEKTEFMHYETNAATVASSCMDQEDYLDRIYDALEKKDWGDINSYACEGYVGAKEILKEKKCARNMPAIKEVEKYFKSVDELSEDFEDSPLSDVQVKGMKKQIDRLKVLLTKYYKSVVGVNVRNGRFVFTVFMTHDQLKNISGLKKSDFNKVGSSYLAFRGGGLPIIVPENDRYESGSEEGKELAAKMREFKILK